MRIPAKKALWYCPKTSSMYCILYGHCHYIVQTKEVRNVVGVAYCIFNVSFVCFLDFIFLCTIFLNFQSAYFDYSCASSERMSCYLTHLFLHRLASCNKSFNCMTCNVINLTWRLLLALIDKNSFPLKQLDEEVMWWRKWTASRRRGKNEENSKQKKKKKKKRWWTLTQETPSGSSLIWSVSSGKVNQVLRGLVAGCMIYFWIQIYVLNITCCYQRFTDSFININGRYFCRYYYTVKA